MTLNKRGSTVDNSLAAGETPSPYLLRPTQREVFLSYSRSDRQMAERLDDALLAAGRTTWIDRSGIEPTEEWWLAISAGIDRSDNFVLLVTPRSVASPWCVKEVEAAAARSKRLIPVLGEPTDPAALPPLMAARQWIDCTTDFDAGVLQLIEALDRDLVYVHEHTRLLGRAIDWKEGRGGLLTRMELAAAEQWLGSAQREPAITPLHTELIIASRRAATGTLRTIVLASALAVVVAVSLAIFAFRQRNEARRQTEEATRNLADTMAARTLSEAKPSAALKGAVAAIDKAVTPATRDALLRMLQRTDKLRMIFGPDERDSYFQRLAFDATGTRLAALGFMGDISVWELPTGSSRNTHATGSTVRELVISGDLVAGETGVWRGNEPEPLFAFEEGDEPHALALSATRFAAARGGSLDLCTLDGKSCIHAAVAGIQLLAFTGADAELLVTASKDEIRIRDSRTLRFLRSMELPGVVRTIGGSATEAVVTVVLTDNTVCTMNVESDSPQCRELAEYGDTTIEHVYGPWSIPESQIAVTAGGRLLAITDSSEGAGLVGIDNSIAVWDASRERGSLLPLRRNVAVPDPSKTRGADAPSVTFDGNAFQQCDHTGACVSRPLQPGNPAGWEDDDAEVEIFAVSPDGRRVATRGGTRAHNRAERLVLWDLESGKMITSHAFTTEDHFSSIAFGKDVIVTADNSRIRLFDAATLASLGEPIEVESTNLVEDCTAIAFPDGSHAGARCGKTSFLYTLDLRAWRALALQRAAGK